MRHGIRHIKGALHYETYVIRSIKFDIFDMVKGKSWCLLYDQICGIRFNRGGYNIVKLFKILVYNRFATI